MGHIRAGTAYGLDTARADHWSRRAACRDDPEAWFAPDGKAHWRPREALHVCRVHCPVLADCRDYAREQEPAQRASLILGGVAYDSQGAPAREARWSMMPITCARCRRVRRAA